MLSLKKLGLIALFLLVIGGLSTAYWLTDGRQPPLGLGDTLQGFRLSGDSVDSRQRQEVAIESGRWWLIHYHGADRSSSIGRARHIGKLLQRFQNAPISSLGLIDPNRSDIALGMQDLDPGYPLLIDISRRSANRLQLGKGEDRVWMVDPRGVVRFTASGDFLLDDDLRQLMEKMLLGQVTRQDPDEAHLLGPGELFPQSNLLELGVDRIVSRLDLAREGFNRFVVFTADCVSCSLNSFLNRFHSSYGSLERRGRKVAGVFSSRFSPLEIARQAEEIGIEAPLFVSEEEMAGIEDSYFLSSLISPVVVIDTDSDGVVQEVRSFDEVRSGLAASGQSTR